MHRSCVGPECQPPVGQRVVKGFLAHPVAGEQQALPDGVPEGEGEHAVDAGKEVVAPLLVAVDEHLGVCGSA